MDKTTPQPIPTKDWPPELFGIVKDMQGNPINVHKLMANNPALLRAWWPFRNHSVNGGSLGQHKGELLILRVSVHMRSWYEWGSHVDRAIKVGIDTSDIRGLLKPIAEQNLSEADSALIQAVDELTKEHQISATSLKTMNKHFTNIQIMDVIAIHGMYLILAAMLKTWDLALDPETLQRISNVTDQKSFLQAAEQLNLPA